MRRVLPLLLVPVLFMTCLSAIASASATAVIFPTVSGSFGHTPTITFPSTNAPTSLETKVLQQGSGPVVHKADLLVANYVGQIWRGKIFDSSFARAEPAGFGIGIGQVIPGWDKVLVGMHVGSRVLMVLPPADGYGPTGNSGAGITGSDTLVFVVDLIGTYSKSIEADAHATKVSSPPAGITVNGKLGSAATVTIAKGTKQPKAVSLKVLDRGSGPKVTAGLVVLQLVVDDWTGKVVQSTWKSGTPEGDPIGDTSSASVLDGLIGIPIGSRVFLQLPKNSSGGPYAIAIDIVAEPHGTSTQAK